jgi:hypothetical protein
MALAAIDKLATERPPTKLCHASLAVGLLLGSIALAAMRIDVLNNYEYGVQISHELAGVMVLAAIGVTALPAAAALRGWDWLLRLGTAASVLLTVWAAVSAYADKQGKDILARQATSAAYEAAQADAAAARQEMSQARAEAAAIAETSSVADLEELAAFQRELIGKESNQRGGCGPNCRKAEEVLKLVFARMPAARAKEAAIARIQAAERRLDGAKGEAKAGPAEPSMLAGYIAHRTGRDAVEIARTIALATTGFAIVVTLLMAGLAHQAVSLVMLGLGVPVQIVTKASHPDGGEAAPARKKTRDAAAKARARKMPKTRRPVPAEQQIAVFVRETFRPGVELTGAEVYELFSAWWRAHCSGELMPSQSVLSVALVEAGINREKRGGKIRYSEAAD